MKVNYSIVVDETFRRRLRAALGRGGMATRKEIRVWMGGIINEAGVDLPQPKVRRRRVVVAKPVVDGTAICSKCDKPRSEHGEVSGNCPLSRTVKPGSRFVPAEAR